MTDKAWFKNISLLVVGIAIGALLQPLSTLHSFAQAGCQTFPETGKAVCGRFLEYWQTHGGLAQQGFPISSPFTEISDLNGKSYTVQYFERSVFELHPENQPPNDVLLSQLGTFQFKRKYPNGEPSGAPPPTQPPAQPTPPAATGPKLEIIDTNTQPSSIGGRSVVALAKNTGNVELVSVEVVSTFKDQSGKIVGTGSASCLCMLRPGDTWPFFIYNEAEFANFDLQPVFQAATASQRANYINDFTVKDVNIVPLFGGVAVSAVGTVQNNSSNTAQFVKVFGAAFDANGKVIDVGSSYAKINTLAPGASSPFQVDFLDIEEAASVKLFTYARKQ